MKLIEDEKAWAEAWLDTPVSSPKHAANPTDAMKQPGCAVKSKEHERAHGFPCHFGRVVAYDEAQDLVRVRTHDGDTPKRVWEGTVRQFFSMWDCD